jgi:protein-tyrosine phosphatase
MYVDLHLHLLPGIDDGPADEAAGLAFAERLAADGVHEATVTPHVGHPDYPFDVASIPSRRRAFQAALDRVGIPLRLRPGGEIHPRAATSLGSAELEVVAHGPRGARWVLLEVPFAGVDAAFLAACRHVRGHGFGLLIAHPERAAGLIAGGLAMLRGELEAGALLQVNVCSLLGRHGDEVQAAAVHLVRSGLAYVVASDGHGSAGRDHSLRAGADRLRAIGASAMQSRRLTAANPRFLLDHGIPRQTPESVAQWGYVAAPTAPTGSASRSASGGSSGSAAKR